jgi:hypothetical protein
VLRSLGKHAHLLCAGAAGLDKRQRKAFEAERLKGLKAKAEKGPRIPASIGFGALPLVVLQHAAHQSQLDILCVTFACIALTGFCLM